MILFLILLFGLLSDSLLSVLVGIVGSRRRLGFGWSFLISLFLTPLVGLICALISDPLPAGQSRWGCIALLLAFFGFLCLGAFLALLFAVCAA